MKARPFNRKRNKYIIWKLICITLMFFLVGISSQAIAQQVELPPLIKFKGSDTGADGKPITLEATLVKPEGKGPFPAVIVAQPQQGHPSDPGPAESARSHREPRRGPVGSLRHGSTSRHPGSAQWHRRCAPTSRRAWRVWRPWAVPTDSAGPAPPLRD